MKIFLRKTVWFLIPGLLIAFGMEIAIRQIPNDYSTKKEYLDRYAPEIGILILGNSHSYRGINPIDLSEHAFNAAHVSQTLDLDRKILEKYISKMDKLHTLILNVSYPSLWGKLGSGNESWRGKYYTLFYKIPTGSRIKNSNLILNQQLSVSLGQIRRYYLDGKNLITISPLGWGGDRTPLKTEKFTATGYKAASRHTRQHLQSDKEMKIFEENLDHLQNIIQECRKRGVKVILYTPPAHQIYRKHMQPEQLEMTIHTLKNLDRKYSNVSYYNFMEDSTFLPADFYDADHLNPAGAKKLTRKLGKVIMDNKNIEQPIGRAVQTMP